MAMDFTISIFVLCIIFLYFTLSTSDFCAKIFTHIETKSWLDARRTCKNLNQTLLKPTHLSQLSSCKGNFEDFWIDKYKLESSWIEIYGCYTWIDNSLYEIQSFNSCFIPVVCERKCPHTDFFGIKEDECFCIDQTLKEYYLSSTSSSYCSEPCRSDSHLFCGGQEAINLYKRVPSEDVKKQIVYKKCSSLDCENGEIGLNARVCNEPLQILCNNGYLTSSYENWTIQHAYCRSRQYSYKYEDDSVFFCNTAGQSPSWSGVFRSVIDEWSQGFPIDDEHEDCFKTKIDNNKYVAASSKCTKNRKYICVKESNTLTETSSLQPIRTTELTTDGTGIFFQRKTTHDISTNTTTNAENLNFVNEISASSRGGIIAGAVIAVSVIVGFVIVVIIIVQKRDVVFRDFKSKDKIKEKTHTYSATLNQGYGLAKSLDSGRSQGYEFAKPFSKSHDMTGNSLKNSYEFAVVIKDDDYIYTDTNEGEYDILHNKDKRKIREGEGNLYSYTRVGVGTENVYDTTYGAKENDSDIYDHSSGVVKQTGDNNIDENPYDHTHTNM